MTSFPKWMFRGAALYGVTVLLPLYYQPLPQVGGEVFLGFIGLALVFQGMFWIIGNDPARYRALMPIAMAEKLVFGLPGMVLFVSGYPVMPGVVVFAGIDLALALGFYLAWRKTA